MRCAAAQPPAGHRRLHPFCSLGDHLDACRPCLLRHLVAADLDALAFGRSGLDLAADGDAAAADADGRVLGHGVGHVGRLRAGLGDLVARHGAACFYQVALLDQSAPLPERRFRLRIGDQLGRLTVAQIRQKDVVFIVEDFGFERQETLSLPKREVEFQ